MYTYIPFFDTYATDFTGVCFGNLHKDILEQVKSFLQIYSVSMKGKETESDTIVLSVLH